MMRRIRVICCVVLLVAGADVAPSAVVAEEEPFDYFRNSWNVIGLKDYAEGSRVTPQNEILLAGNRKLRMRFGRSLLPLSARQRKSALDGWIPVISLNANDGQVRYEFTLWSTPLPTVKDWRKAFDWPTEGESFLNWIAVKVTNQGSEPADAKLKVERIAPTPEDPTMFSWNLPSGGSQEVVLRVPFEPVEDAGAFAKEDADVWLDRTVTYWRDRLAKAARIDVPCRKASEALLAAHVCQMIASDHGELHGGEGFYDRFYIRDGAYQLMELEEAGLWDAAEKAARWYLTRQRDDGRFETQKGQLDANGQAPWVLWQYYKITGNKQWLAEAEQYRAAIDAAWERLDMPHFPPSWEKDGTHWGNTETLWPTPVFERNDPRVRALAREVRDNHGGGFAEGTIRWLGTQRSSMRYRCVPANQRLLSFLVAVLATCTSTLTLHTAAFAAEVETIYQCDFNGRQRDQPLKDWVSFSLGTKPRVTVLESGVLKGQRSDHGGLVALSRWFDAPSQRLLIEFSFAVSSGPGRVFHVWTQEPNGKDASQFNLCVQGGRLQQFDGRTRTWEDVGGRIQASGDLSQPIWHRLRAIVDAGASGIDIWLSEPGSDRLPASPTATVAAYRTELPFGGLSFVSGTRIAPDAWYLVDDLVVKAGADLPEPGDAPPLPDTYKLWSGPPIPRDPMHIPFAKGIEHRTIHRPDADGYKFLHGAAILEHEGVFYANWANSPVNENGPHETLQGRRSTDGGVTWSSLEVIGPGFDGADRHSHGVLFVHEGRIWTICARFGIGEPGRRFPGLKAEAFVLDPQTDHWESRGIVMKNCWPYDAPVKMNNGNYITGGQDKDGLPVVAISHGDDFTKWDSILIPYHPKLAPSFAETTVWAEDACVTAVIRGGAGVAWIATSEDHGRTWTTAQPSNLPMPRAKAYLGKLSTGQLFLVSNYRNRDTLVISVSRPAENTLSRMWRIRHGKSDAPRFQGAAKGKQWSYPYAHEFQGKLYIVYSVGKEECGLSVVPVASLANS